MDFVFVKYPYSISSLIADEYKFIEPNGNIILEMDDKYFTSLRYLYVGVTLAIYGVWYRIINEPLPRVFIIVRLWE